jgi:hypothetical protein
MRLMGNGIKKLVLRAIWVFCALCTLLLVLSIVSRLAPVQAFLKSEIEKSAAGTLSCTVSIGAVSADFFNAVTARSVKISGLPPDTESVFIRRLSIRINPLALAKGTVDVRLAALSGAKAHILRKRDGVFVGPIDLGKLARQRNAGLSFAVRGITARQCTLSYTDAPVRLGVGPAEVSAFAKFARRDSLVISCSAVGGRLFSPWWNGGMQTLNAVFSASPSGLSFVKGVVKLDSASLAVAGNIPFDTAHEWSLSTKVETSVLSIVPARPFVGKSAGGRVGARATMNGTSSDPKISLDVSCGAMRMQSWSVDSAKVGASYIRGHLAADGSLYSPLGRSRITLSSDLRSLFSSPELGRYRLRLTARIDDLPGLMNHFWSTGAIPFSHGTVEALCAGNGLQSMPDRIALKIAAAGKSIPAESMTAAVGLAMGKWNVSAKAGKSVAAEGSGVLNKRGKIAGKIRVNIPDLGPFAFLSGDSAAYGHIDAVVGLAGTLKRPDVSATLSDGDVMWHGIHAHNLFAKVSLEHGKLRIDTSSAALAVGSLGRTLPYFGVEGVSGRICASVHARGKPDSLAADIAAGLAGLSYEGYAVDTAALRCTVAGNSIRAPFFFLQRKSSGLTGEGNASWQGKTVDAAARLNLTSGGRESGTVEAAFRFGRDSLYAHLTAGKADPAVFSPWLAPLSRFSGALSADATASGKTSNPGLMLSYRYEGTGKNPAEITSSGRFAAEDSALTGSLSIEQTTVRRPIEVTVKIPFSPGGIFKGVGAIGNGAFLTVSGDTIPYQGLLAAFVPGISSKGAVTIRGVLSKNDGAWSVACSAGVASEATRLPAQNVSIGPVTLDLSAHGPLSAPRVGFSVAGDSVSLPAPVVSHFHAHGSIVDSIATVDAFDAALAPGGTVTATSRGVFSKKQGIRSVAVTTDLYGASVASVQHFIGDAVRIAGGAATGRVDAEWKNGTLRANGGIRLSDAAFFIEGCETKIGPVNAALLLRDDTLVLSELSGGAGGGTFTGGGRAVLRLNGLESARAALSVRDARLRFGDDLDLGIQAADVVLSKRTAAACSAEVSLGETRLYGRVALTGLLDRPHPRRATTKRRGRPSPFDSMRLNIHVKSGRALTIDSNIGRAVLGGDVTVTGTPESPAVAGAVAVTEGYVYYLDRKFTVTQGTIRQYDREKIDPVLDIQATCPVSWYPSRGGREDYDVTLSVLGPLSNPEVALSSKPALAQAQIISLLSLGTLETGTGSDVSRLAQNLLSSQAAGLGTRRLSRLLNVESIDIYGNLFGSSRAEPSLSMTKSVTPRLSVTYKTLLSRLGQQQVTASYRLLPFLFLSGDVSERQTGGIDIQLRFSK